MCVDMCADMCVDMFVDMCVDICMDMCMDIFPDTWKDMCTGTHMHMCIGMLMGMRIDMCIDVCRCWKVLADIPAMAWHAMASNTWRRHGMDRPRWARCLGVGPIVGQGRPLLYGLEYRALYLGQSYDLMAHVCMHVYVIVVRSLLRWTQHLYILVIITFQS